MSRTGTLPLVQNRLVLIFMAFSAIAIGIYPLVYFLADDRFGLLNTKTQEILASNVWRFFFYAHIAPGGIALAVGWMQFWRKFRLRNPAWHRRIGKVYVFMVLISATAGIYLSWHATGGIVSGSGFFLLGVIWFVSTVAAWQYALNRDFDKHQKAMILSYAICFAAVSLRIWLPLLEWISGDFMTAYKMVAWICWVPNLVIAILIIRK